MSVTYSLKSNKQLKKDAKTTENTAQINEVLDISFSTNREKDWANILTCHR